MLDALKATDFNGFPVVGEDQRLVGIISRNSLVIIIKNKQWEDS